MAKIGWKHRGGKMRVINNRRSVRTFLPDKVEKDKIDLLIRAAMQAPSAHNQQPWVFLVVENEETIKQLARISSPLKTAPLAIILLTDKRNLKSPDFYTSDMGAATQNLLLEAAGLGLGGCWIGLYNRQTRLETLSEIIDIPEYFEPFSLLAIGYPTAEDANYFIDRYNPDKVFYESF